MTDYTHIGYSDESHWNQDQYRTIGLVTLKAEVLKDIVCQVEQTLIRTRVAEFAWEESAHK